QALFQFQEHDIYLPLVVLEELDRHKKGDSDLSRNARQVTRTLDSILKNGSMLQGFDLCEPSGGKATGKLFFRDDLDGHGTVSLNTDKADNLILGVAMVMAKDTPNVTLVTNDINLRVKALASDVPAQGYRSDRVLSDEDVLPTGFERITEDFWALEQ